MLCVHKNPHSSLNRLSNFTYKSPNHLTKLPFLHHYISQVSFLNPLILIWFIWLQLFIASIKFIDQNTSFPARNIPHTNQPLLFKCLQRFKNTPLRTPALLCWHLMTHKSKVLFDMNIRTCTKENRKLFYWNIVAANTWFGPKRPL